MRSYIVSCTTPNGDLRSRHVEATNHLEAVKQVEAEGFTVLSVDRDEDKARPRSRKRLKRLFISVIVFTLLAALCIAVVWFRSNRHI